jgi:hypothetical protein
MFVTPMSHLAKFDYDVMSNKNNYDVMVIRSISEVMIVRHRMMSHSFR